MAGTVRAVNVRFLLLAATLAAPAQALELDQPEIRFEPDCTTLLTLQLAAEAGADPGQVRVEIASPPTYRKLQKTYPSWVGSAQLERIRHDGESRVQVRSTEPLPSHSSDLVLVLGEGHEPPMFHTLNLPPCAPTTTTREVVWGDTLLEIALERARSLEVDAYTLMLAIQLYNRDAFIHDNINLVRAGARLYIPSETEIARLNLSRQWLVDEIRFQNEQWQNWRRQGTELRKSPTLQERRLQLVPLETRTELASPEPATYEPEPVEPMKTEPAEPGTANTQPTAPGQPEPAKTPPTEPESAESGTANTQPTAPGQTEPAKTPPTEPESAESEPASTAPASPAQPEPEKTKASPTTVEVESGELAQLADKTPDKPSLAKVAGNFPWPGILAAAGILLLTYLFALALSRARQARIIRQSVGDIEDPARRATSALDLAHAHVAANEYDQARPLIRLVLAEGTEQEREEAEKLKSRMASF